MNKSRSESAVITARGVRRTYGELHAVAGVDLDVTRGEIVAILGPNGAGKTTLVEILEGLRRRDAGDVTVLGSDPTSGGPAWRSRIGAVLQLGTETDELTVAEMLESHAAYYPAPLRFDDVVSALDLGGLEDRRVRRLSGGQRRRLDIALGIVGDPELLFLDEPTTGLDAEVRRSIWQLIQRLAAKGTTVVLTTHYLDEVEHLADRTVVIVDGGVVWEGNTDQLRGSDTSSSISFDVLPPGDVADLPPPLIERATVDDGKHVTILADDATDVVAQVMDWASKHDTNPITNLRVGQPSLEDAYLSLLETSHNKENRK